MTDICSIPQLDDHNGWADYWRNVIGVNVVPANTREKKTTIEWKSWQNDPTPQELHDEWKRKGAFDMGMAAIPGRIFHNECRKEFYLVCLDIDNKQALDTVCNYKGKQISIEDIARKTLVEIHDDDLTRAHIYFYSKIPFPKINGNGTLAIEIRSEGSQLVYCSPSIHKNGHPYRILGISDPQINEEFIQNVFDICNRNGSNGHAHGNVNANANTYCNTVNPNLRPIEELFKPNYRIYEGNNRHGAVLRVADSLIKRLRRIFLENKIKAMAWEWNVQHCVPPINEIDFDRQWPGSVKFINKKEENNNTNKNIPEEKGVQLNDLVIHEIYSLISPYNEESLVFSLFGFFHKHDISQVTSIAIIQTLAKDDEERRYKISILEQIYNVTYPDTKDSGSNHLLDALTKATNDRRTAKKMLSRIIVLLIGEQKPVFWLIDTIMKEHTFMTIIDTEEMYCYHNGYFCKRGDWVIRENAELLYPAITKHEVSEIINHIKQQTGIERSEINCNIDIINVQNGLLNIHTKKLSDPTPTNLSTIQIPVIYDPEAKCPLILEFLNQVLRKKDIPVMLQVIGYCLYKGCEFEKAFMLHGGGSNGKGVLIQIIEGFLGESNCSHRSLQDLDSNRFAAADLYGKHVNTFADLKSLRLSNTGNFKMLVSGDSITGEHKFEHSFTFRNYAKLIFSANEIPESDDKTDAFYRRWIIFHFDKQFHGGNEDTNLAKKLTTSNE
ncbi:MAG: phage/plasmid primase, P4 family, partial [Candidatus Nitrosopolaris sp.]